MLIFIFFIFPAIFKIDKNPPLFWLGFQMIVKNAQKDHSGIFICWHSAMCLGVTLLSFDQFQRVDFSLGLILYYR